MKEKFNAAVFSDIVNMIKVKMRIMVLLVALDQLIPIFQDHSSIKEPQKKKKKKKKKSKKKTNKKNKSVVCFIEYLSNPVHTLYDL